MKAIREKGVIFVSKDSDDLKNLMWRCFDKLLNEDLP